MFEGRARREFREGDVHLPELQQDHRGRRGSRFQGVEGVPGEVGDGEIEGLKEHGNNFRWKCGCFVFITTTV